VTHYCNLVAEFNGLVSKGLAFLPTLLFSYHYSKIKKSAGEIISKMNKTAQESFNC